MALRQEHLAEAVAMVGHRHCGDCTQVRKRGRRGTNTLTLTSLCALFLPELIFAPSVILTPILLLVQPPASGHLGISNQWMCLRYSWLAVPQSYSVIECNRVFPIQQAFPPTQTSYFVGIYILLLQHSWMPGTVWVPGKIQRQLGLKELRIQQKRQSC